MVAPLSTLNASISFADIDVLVHEPKLDDAVVWVEPKLVRDGLVPPPTIDAVGIVGEAALYISNVIVPLAVVLVIILQDVIVHAYGICTYPFMPAVITPPEPSTVAPIVAEPPPPAIVQDLSADKSYVVPLMVSVLLVGTPPRPAKV